MIKLSATWLSIGKRYPVASAVIWELITDTAQWPRWGPTVKDVEFPPRIIYNGATGRVLTAANVWLPFDVVEFEEERYWNWKVASIRATGHRIRKIGTGACELWFEVPTIAGPYALICQIALKRIGRLI